ncbi:NAD(P)-dependent oxidoreductase [Candidatus Nitronereus thalassa]|uniref:NAD(P)-dependent oxidoreductase n=1 Tax=Candidatus Nitronereus thalassa TaxID=3020898 RepID=A0ABU3K5Q2_9BACT|nr:NAD(P)-dependent oxidoreductase [Candidatus Nitronereus thalassa]MDT7041678.1 NAD(P)-dependent oxidoreductase [Candidatus Nitronereus thalassa]
MKVLVTGGAGYLGSVLCEHLLKAEYEVTVIDNLLYQQHSLFHLCANPKFEFVCGDARNKELMRSNIKDTDVIIPLAAIVGAPACDRDPCLAKSVNLEAIQLLLKMRSPTQLIIFPTTNSGYGTQSGESFCTEDTPLEPISLYGKTKVQAEQELLNAPNVVTLRLATVFGMSARMRLDLLVNNFVYQAFISGYLVIFEKDFKRNFIHIRDVAECMVHCMKNSSQMVGRPYNAGLDSANISKEELAKLIQAHIPNFYVHYASIGSDPDKRNYIVSNQRLREAGFQAHRSLDEGILELLKGFRMMGRLHLGNV